MRGEWFRSYDTAPAGAPLLYCFPHAGGAASAYVPLSRALAPSVGVLSVQYPGRQERRREPAVGDIGRLAGLIAEQLRPGAGRPYAFFGHSMGAVVAFETARRLQGQGVPGPVHLFVSGRSAPSAGPAPDDRAAGDEELRERIRRLGGTGSRILDDPEVMEMVMPALRADYGAVSRYRWEPGPPLACPLTVLVGDRDPVVTLDGAAAWQRLSARSAGMHVFPGGHFYLDEHTERVAGTIVASLDLGPGGEAAA